MNRKSRGKPKSNRTQKSRAKRRMTAGENESTARENGSLPTRRPMSPLRIFFGLFFVVAGAGLLLWSTLQKRDEEAVRQPAEQVPSQMAPSQKDGDSNDQSNLSESKLDGPDLSSWQELMPTDLSDENAANEQTNWVSVQTDAKGHSGYIGTSACIDCHRSKYEGYLTTTHAISTHIPTPENSPPPQTFDHNASSRTYEIDFKGDKMFHREILKSVDDQVIAKTEREIVLGVGSGTHAVTYLCDHEGFLKESPVTWFRSSDRFEMSPGYDQPIHQAFTRVARSECLYCHVGQIQFDQENPNRYSVVEAAISCERCHGPGEAHVARYEHQKDGESVSDAEMVSYEAADQIVHPAELSREASEAICQQCHLQGIAQAQKPDGSVWDFRPGDRMIQHRTDFHYAGLENSKVVGHVEQMHESKCYTESDTLTCISCHDPHHQPLRVDAVQYFREKCYACHDDDTCGIEHDVRIDRNANDCSACHMPKQETNVTHTALHHHRVGIFKDGYDSKSHSPTKATPPNDKPKNDQADPKEIQIAIDSVLPDTAIGDDERLRRLGMGLYFNALRGEGVVDLRPSLNQTMQQLLDSLAAYPDDHELRSMLASLSMFAGNSRMAGQLVGEADQHLPPGNFFATDAHLTKAKIAYSAGDFDTAAMHYRAVSQARHAASNFYDLGLAQYQAGKVDLCVESLERALEIDPAYVEAHRLMWIVLKSIDPQRSESHVRAGKAIQKITPTRP